MLSPSKADTPTNDENKPKSSWTIKDLEDNKRFNELFAHKVGLGDGGDGTVHAYEHSTLKMVIAVKLPKDGQPETREPLMDEIRNLKILGKHDHIIDMLTHSESYDPHGPAIFLELCDLGDLYSYRQKWCDQERENGRLERVSEATIWKLLKDMSLGLDFIHNRHDTCYVHNDFKPGNILVSNPDNWHEADGIPAEPVFKIIDFARLTPFPTPPRSKPVGWRGTPEFAPPLAEQNGPIRPSADIWCLGATIQSFALNVMPTQSDNAFIESRRAVNKDYPDDEDDEAWESDYWRKRIPTVYRPLNGSEQQFKVSFDLSELPHDYKPYGSPLNLYYTELFNGNERARVTSADLVRYVVPLIDGDIAIVKKIDRAEECFDRAIKIREAVRARQASRLMPIEVIGEVRKALSYNGDDWGEFPS